MMSDHPNPEAKPRRKWVRWLLIASLGLNLLVVGLAVGTALRFAGPEPLRAPPRSMGVAVIRELPPEMRRDMFRRAREASGERHGSASRDWQALITLLQAERFDRAAAADLLARQTEARGRFEKSLQVSLLDKLNAMSPAERAAYAERLMEAQERHKKRKDHKSR